jgi:hypothetical protein
MRMGFGMVLLLAATSAGGLGAQDLVGFGRLEPGQTVQIKTVGGSRFATRLGDGESDSLRFAHAEIPFEAARVDSLWVRGRATVTGMIVGAAVAGPITFGLFAWVCEIVSEGTGCDEWGLVTELGLSGAAAGALVGAGIGSLVPKWRLRYARDRDLLITPLLAPDGRLGVAIRF